MNPNANRFIIVYDGVREYMIIDTKEPSITSWHSSLRQILNGYRFDVTDEFIQRILTDGSYPIIWMGDSIDIGILEDQIPEYLI